MDPVKPLLFWNICFAAKTILQLSQFGEEPIGSYICQYFQIYLALGIIFEN